MSASDKRINVLIVFILIARYSEAASYTVIVKTGTRSKFLDGPGTDANVYVKLHGVSRSSGLPASTSFMQLTGLKTDQFEEGATDTFTNLQDSQDLTNINKIEVKRGSWPIAADWLLDKISVTTEKGETYLFNADFWLTKKGKAYPVASLISASDQSVTPPEDSPTTVSQVTLPPAQHVVTTSKVVTLPSVVQQPVVSTSKVSQVTLPPVVQPVTTSKISTVTLPPVVTTSKVSKVSLPSLVRPDTSGKSKVTYIVTVRTGMRYSAGTNANVFLRIYGTSRSTGQPSVTSRLFLSNKLTSSANPFQRGQTDIFTVEDKEDLINFRKIEVMRGKGSKWYLKQVSITTQDGLKSDFTAKAWLKIPYRYVQFQVDNPVKRVTPAPGPPLPISPAPVPPAPVIPVPKPVAPKPNIPAPPPKPGVTYNIVVYTSSVSKSGSKAQVYVTLYGSLITSSEIHLKSPSLETKIQAASTKIFEVQMQDVGQLSKIRIRQDTAAESPNWRIDKVLVISQSEIVYEFLVSEWLLASKPLVKPMKPSYPATSMKFLAYSPCIQPLEARLHPSKGSALVLLKHCGRLANFFKLHPDGVIQHLASGMCIQGSRRGDPRNTAHGDIVMLNYPCTVFQSPFTTPSYALQFKFTAGGSLKETKSGKCISTNGGRLNWHLTFSNVCDTPDTKIVFIDKKKNVLYPEPVAKSPTKLPGTPLVPGTLPPLVPPTIPSPLIPPTTPKPPGVPSIPSGLSPPGVPKPPSGLSPPGVPKPPSTPSPPGVPKPPSTPSPPGVPKPPSAPSPPVAPSSTSPRTPMTGSQSSVTNPENYGGDSWPVYCPSNCLPSSCTSTCQSPCCSNLQQPAMMPLGFPSVVRCPNYCSPGLCRSECPVGCCFPNLFSWNNEKYDEHKENNER